AQRARPFGFRLQEIHRLLDAEIRRRDIFRNRRRIPRPALAALDERPVAPDAHANRLAAGRVNAQIHRRIADVVVALDLLLEPELIRPGAAIELAQEVDPVALALG